MGWVPWSELPNTEKGAQALLRQLAEAEQAGDLREVCRGKIRQSWMSRWVAMGPGDSWHGPIEAARQAHEIAVRLGDPTLQFKALVAGGHGLPAEDRLKFYAELDRLAEEANDVSLRAEAIEVRGRLGGDGNPAQHYRRALEMHTQGDDRGAMARTLFGLAIHGNDPLERVKHALQAADLYEQLGAPTQATRSLQLAALYGEGVLPHQDLVALFHRILNTSSGSNQASNHLGLSRAYVRNQEPEKALHHYEEWLRLDEYHPDGDEERWEYERLRVKLRRRIARQMGDLPAVAAASARLRELHQECLRQRYRREDERD